MALVRIPSPFLAAVDATQWLNPANVVRLEITRTARGLDLAVWCVGRDEPLRFSVRRPAPTGHDEGAQHVAVNNLERDYQDFCHALGVDYSELPYLEPAPKD